MPHARVLEAGTVVADYIINSSLTVELDSFK